MELKAVNDMEPSPLILTDLLEAHFIPSTVETVIEPLPINFPFTLSASSLRVIKC